MKRIVLCADDYGQARTISQGILALIQKKRLSATSCMVNSKYWLTHSKWLLPYQNDIDVGLHFNLTEGKALSPEYKAAMGESLMPLASLLRKSFFRRLDQHVIEKELQAQIDEFVKGMGFFPRFVDGHQHVHQFPIIRDALIRVYKQSLQCHKSYIRLVKPSQFLFDLKKILIFLMGSFSLKKELKENFIPYNQSFAGIYLFYQANHYCTLFPHFLKMVKDGGLIMCHPALKGISNDQDSIAKARFAEYQYLNSDKFLEDCRKQNVILQKEVF